ncbi:hypothetical protein SAMN02745975_03783 [Geosporobacter subterraneus DSM 17957]|uniref:Yip1 domain-containing protein n=1 Tax=Geosporobacter subterraneus DSM 17957 TaxID=1121919 RepID=A0A1M6Q881_9FIRM|nr:hypothetical protein [Geosporobacter subterraneus]SHK16358.1 hypothetical protein SAMN02745975_03783 [Geosporobacter subterraneus DSM 17957]
MEQERVSFFRTVIGMMISPAGVLKSALSSNRWYLSVVISLFAFGLFFLQTGLDLYKTGQKEFPYVFAALGVGAAYGLFVIPLVAVFVWILLKAARIEESMFQVVSAFCLSYSGTLIYGIIGTVVSLTLGWKTAVAFGVTGVVWAVGPMMYTIRELTNGKTYLSIFISAVVGLAVMISWGYLGNL